MPGRTIELPPLPSRDRRSSFRPVDKLSHPDKLHLDAADGWLLLDRPDYALEEFDRLSESCRQDAKVLERKWQTLAMTKDWTAACETAQRLIELHPDRSFGWIHRAYALRRMPGGGLEQAWDALLPVAPKFPKEFLIPYNLACYAACMGRLEAAWDWLQCAGRIAGWRQVRRMALADEDLVALHEQVLKTEKR